MPSVTRKRSFLAVLASLGLFVIMSMSSMLSAGQRAASASVANLALDLSQPQAKEVATLQTTHVKVADDSMCSRFRSESPFYGSSLVNLQREAQAQQSAFCRIDSHLNPDSSASGKYAKASVQVRSAAYQLWIYRNVTTDTVSWSIKNRGHWDLDATEKVLDALELARGFLQRKLGKAVDPVFADIGTNLGWFTSAISAHGYSTMSIEPMMPNEVALRRTLCSNPKMMERVTYFNRGLSSKEQTCRFYSTESNVGNGIVRCGDDVAPAGAVLREETELVRLDDYALNYLCRRNEEAAYLQRGKQTAAFAVVKMDVEGFEPLVLAGGQQFFKDMEIPFVYMEYNPAELRSRDPSRDPIQLLFDMMDFGYSISLHNFMGPAVSRNKLRSRTFSKLIESVYCTHRSFVSA